VRLASSRAHFVLKANPLPAFRPTATAALDPALFRRASQSARSPAPRQVDGALFR
jgi:hypothetical protein